MTNGLASRLPRAAAWLLLVALPLGVLADPPRPRTATPRPSGTPSAPAAAEGRAGRVTLNLPEVDVAAATRAIGAMLGRQVVVDPRVKGSLSLVTEGEVSVAQAVGMFVTQLRGLGFAMVDGDGLLKVMPEAEARYQAPVAQAGQRRTDNGLVLTRIFALEHENASNLVAVLRPLMTPNSLINVNTGNNSLVVTDHADNLARLGTLVRALDTPRATDVEVIPLEHAQAAAVAATVQKLLDGGALAGGSPAAGQGAGSGSGVSNAIGADVRTNALLVRAATPARLAAIRALVARLDRPGQWGAGGSNVHVIYLRHAESTRLASVLRAAFAAGSGSTGAGGSGGGGGAAPAGLANPGSGAAGGGSASAGAASSALNSAQATAPVSAAAQPSLGGFIQADPATNALIVTAVEPLYREVQAVVDLLDTPRAQLYVESLIVEVDASKALDVGLQWESIFNISSSTELTLGTIAKAVESMAGTNILSTANLVTIDNEEAKIVVGQNVPFVTGQYTSSTSSSPFQTIERKDVGITLRIRPQIGPNGSIRMAIFQESSSVSSSTAPGTSNAGPTTNKRSIESNVAVGNGRIMVLGGLIEDEQTSGFQQVPVVGNLPLVGALFRAISRSRKKTNLVVFLRPTVMPDEAAADQLSTDRYDEIRATQVMHARRGTRDPLGDPPAPLLPARPGLAGSAPGTTGSELPH